MTSAAFLAAGILRSNLAFSFWGGGFLLLVLLCSLGIALEAARATRQLGSDGAGFSFRAVPSERGAWFPGASASFRRASPLKGAVLPWITVEYIRTFRPEGRTGAFRAGASASAPASEKAIPAPARGRWVSGEFAVRVRDALGIARWERPIAEPDEFVVAPEPAEFGLRPPPGGGGPDKSSPESFKRSDEFLDSRKYHPGDDARRINWKQYGHSGELFVRVGEREPPPKARYLLAVDPVPPRGLARKTARACAEAVIALAAGCALELASRGARVSIAAPGAYLEEGEEGGGDPASEAARLLGFLAGIEAEGSRADLPMPPAPKAASSGLILFCAPDSARAEAVLAGGGRESMAVVPLLEEPGLREYLVSLAMRGRSCLPPRVARRYNAYARLYARRLGGLADARAL